MDVEIDLDVRPKTAMIPTVAVQPSQKGPFVYVVKADQTVEMRPVQVALTEGDNSAISETGRRAASVSSSRARPG